MASTCSLQLSPSQLGRPLPCSLASSLLPIPRNLLEISSRAGRIWKKSHPRGAGEHCGASETPISVQAIHLLKNQSVGSCSALVASSQIPLKGASHACLLTTRKTPKSTRSCSSREPFSNSSIEDSREARRGGVVMGNSRKADSGEARNAGGARNNPSPKPTISDSTESLRQFREPTEIGRGSSDAWTGGQNTFDEELWHRPDDWSHVKPVQTKYGESLKSAEAAVSHSQVLQSWEVDDGAPVENHPGGSLEIVEDELQLVEDFKVANKSGKLLKNLLGVGASDRLTTECKAFRQQTVQATAGNLHPARTGVLNILSRDVEIVQESIRLAVKQAVSPRIKKVQTRILMYDLGGVDEGCLDDKGLEVHNGKTPSLSKEGVTYLADLKDGLLKGGGLLLTWGKIWGNGTGVEKIVIRDLEVVQQGISYVKESFKEMLRLRGLEDSSALSVMYVPWPQSAYHGLSGKTILTADIEALRSYGNYVKGLLDPWRVPLPLSYDPEAVASYFMQRPHVLLFRLLEVSAAFCGVALRHGIDKAHLWMDKHDLTEKNESLQSTPQSAEALKRTLVRLGPTFIKVAQSLSSRPDIVGIGTAKVLSELQDRLPPFPTKDAMAVIENELGLPVTQAFSSLSEHPVAAASLGQVYKGLTLEGEVVAVKVQRPDLLFNVARDIYILRLGLGVVRKLARMNSDISVLADELGHGLFGELDYTLEASNALEFETLHKKLSYVKVPRTLPHLTRRRVLTMEWIYGDRPLDLQLIAQGTDLNGGLASMSQRLEAKHRLDALVKKGVECSLVQLLETGVMHADPHPGNLLYTREGILAYLDFGLLARVNKKHRSAMLAVIAHLVNGEWESLANDFADLDILKPSTDRFALRLALERAFGEGPDAVVQKGVPDIQFGQVTGKLWKVALKFRFRLPPYYTLVLRSLASLEGIAVSVDPDYKVFSVAYPYVVRRLLSDNSHPSRQVLQSLVLTQKKEFRWDRIAGIMATSGRASLDRVGHETDHITVSLPTSPSKRLPGSKDLSSSLLSYTLSKEGTSVRRVLLEADTKSLAEAFISAPATSFRRKVAILLAEAFYQSILRYTDRESQGRSTSIGGRHAKGRVAESVTTTTEEIASDRSLVEMVPMSEDRVTMSSFQLSSEKTLMNQRLGFVLRALASRLTGHLILLVRVGWTFITMVGFAAALAAHEYAITLCDQLFGSGHTKTSERTERIASHDTNHEMQVTADGPHMKEFCGNKISFQ